MFSKFLLGSIKIEDPVREVLGRTPLDLVSRHAVCEHGVVSPRRLKQNALSLSDAGEIQSEYLINPLNPKDGSVLVTTREGWGETVVTIKKYKQRRKSDGLDI
ncbi:hypothetical protein ACSLNH_11830 [Comamonas kerstersii]|uniref:hypothetical protein n=1 Tax=Comamonas kerstersii TaxID=225992 RepID=UPI003EE30882